MSVHTTGLAESLSTKIALKLFDAKVSDFEVCFVRCDLGEGFTAFIAVLRHLPGSHSIVDAIHVFLEKEKEIRDQLSGNFFHHFQKTNELPTRRIFLELNFMSHM